MAGPKQSKGRYLECCASSCFAGFHALRDLVINIGRNNTDFRTVIKSNYSANDVRLITPLSACSADSSQK